MSKYTTGEIAKLCNVSVRTVQYYDTRNILVPSELSEGGRRLYSEEDLRKMRVICFLREMDFSINAIGEILSEEHPEHLIELLLEEQSKILRNDIDHQQKRLSMLEGMKRELKAVSDVSVESIGDVAHILKNRKKLRKLRAVILCAGIVAELGEIATALLWIFKGVWWPFVAWMALIAIPLCIWLSVYYYRNVAYICPECHSVFKPTFGEMFWAAHTPNTRKLKCKTCGHKGYCVETCPEGAE